MTWLAENWIWVLFAIAFMSMHLFGHGYGHGGHGGGSNHWGHGGCGGHDRSPDAAGAQPRATGNASGPETRATHRQ